MPKPHPAAAILLLACTGTAQVSTDGPRYRAPDGAEILAAHANTFRALPERYQQDRRAIEQAFPSRIEARRNAQLKAFYQHWRKVLQGIDFDALNRSEQVDYLLFRQKLEKDQHHFQTEAQQLQEVAGLVPFAKDIAALEYRRRALETYDLQALAPQIEALAHKIDNHRSAIRGIVHKARHAEHAQPRLSEDTFKAAGDATRELKKTVDNWFGFYRGYDPLLTWWLSAPTKELSDALQAYADTFKKPEKPPIRPRPRPREPGINGENHAPPAGAEHLGELLRREMIPYNADELLDLARKELAWCVQQQKKAAAEMGFGDDTAKALEHVKSLHVPIGKQPALIRKLALEAIDFLEERELVTLPTLAKDTWRIGMMSPARQRINPFFTGGATISVSYPHADMAHADKLMSMRGNNPHFSAATVHHELIPGHHLQDFMTSRYNTHRRAYSTVFWTEGWALYWEMLLWDLGFADSPEDRMGFLFWRMHRCARILFSLGYHLGEMTPQQCVDLLVETVGHETRNAEAEIRRSFSPHTPILYQCAYMLGGIQFYVLRRELVDSGKMTHRQFHDRILRGGRIPVELIRAELTDTALTPDYKTQWRFAEKFTHE